jgi:membrane-bound ClpP family serine protease
MSTLVIILLIVLGIVLFLIEFFLVPGITVAGIGGVLLLAAGVVISYKLHGNPVGNLVLIGTLVFVTVSLGFFLRAKTWSKFMLNENIEGQSIESLTDEKVKVGDLGKTITRLAPMGNVMVNGFVIEARSTGEYLSENTEIVVIKIDNAKLIVKPKNI